MGKWINKQRSCLWEKHLRISVFLPRLEAPQISQRESCQNVTNKNKTVLHLFIYLFICNKETADKKNVFTIYSFTMNTLEMVVSESECFNISVTKRALWPIPTGRAVQLWNYELTSRYVHLLLTKGAESQKGFTIPKSVWAQGDIAALITNSSFPLRSWLAAASAQRVRGRGDEGEPKTAIGTKLTVRF